MTALGALPDRGFWRGRRVLVTGHTGFKGGWLATWLLDMGAEVVGYAQKPDTEPAYFELCDLAGRLRSVIGDVRDADDLLREVQAFGTECVFHLAAQPLVRRSYRDPVETFGTNVMGTVNVLEAARRTLGVRAVVVVTSDKCYEPGTSLQALREDDPMGGRDPYSASKGCAELVTAAYRRSYFDGRRDAPAVTTVRAGNVIGGGDWAEDRLVPDAVRAFQRAESLIVRNPEAVRPWQHVLEPVAGYLVLAERLHREGAAWAGAWNFGPDADDAVSVGTLADLLVRELGAAGWRRGTGASSVPEAQTLRLDAGKACRLLGWRPRLTLAEAVRLTAAWYRAALAGAPMYEMTCEQIRSYEATAPIASHRVAGVR